MRIRRTIKFALHVRHNAATKKNNIRIRVSYAGHRIDMPTGCSVKLKNFDAEKGRLVVGRDADRINAELNELDARINDIFSRFELIEKKLPEPEELWEAFNHSNSPAKKKKSRQTNCYETFDQFIRSVSKQNGWTLDTIRKFNNVKTNLQNFDKNLTLESLSEDKLGAFLQYLYSINLMNSTIAKNIVYLKIFLRWCYRKKIYDGNLHETFRSRIKGIEGFNKVIIFLTWEELMHLYEFKIQEADSIHKKHLSYTLDTFLFCCFTGLRHSDVFKLTKLDIKKDTFSFVTQKTGESLIIELNKYSRAILDRYKDVQLPGNKALPAFTNQKMNDHLKIICKEAGINTPIRTVYWQGNKRKERVLPKYELITTHAGRRSFIVNALYLGISTEVIMKWTGHSDYNAMKPYMFIVDDLKEREMKKFNR